MRRCVGEGWCLGGWWSVKSKSGWLMSMELAWSLWCWRGRKRRRAEVERKKIIYRWSDDDDSDRWHSAVRTMGTTTKLLLMQRKTEQVTGTCLLNVSFGSESFKDAPSQNLCLYPVFTNASVPKLISEVSLQQIVLFSNDSSSALDKLCSLLSSQLSIGMSWCLTCLSVTSRLLDTFAMGFILVIHLHYIPIAMSSAQVSVYQDS